MKTKNKFLPITMFIGMAMATNAFAQTRTNNYVPKWNSTGGYYENTATPIFDNGNVGIGTTSLSGSHKLDVNGNVNASGYINTNSGFRLNGHVMIKEYNNSTNVFVGDATGGQGNSGNPGDDNTCVGLSSGQNFGSSAARNTFVGSGSGEGVNPSYTDNSFIGYKAGYSGTTGSVNVFIGSKAGYNNLASPNNTAIGYQALYTQNSAIDDPNVALGNEALYYTNAPANTALGYRALYNNTTGEANTACGLQAGYYNQSGSNNAIFGTNAGGIGGGSVNSFSNNSFYGYQSGYGITTGGDNVFTGYKSGYTNTVGTKNVFSGYQSGYGNSTAGENVAIGYEAMKTQSYGSTAYITYNVALGYQALYSNQPNSQVNATGTANTAIGHQALYTNGIGYQNTALGQGALYTNSSGNNNTAVGQSALYYNTAGNNTAIGFSALLNNTSGSYNTANGYQALRQNATGQYNTASGYQAGYNTTGSENIYAGYQAGYANTSGSKNTALGNLSGYTNTTGTNNTCIGYGADVNANNLSNATALGNGAVVTASNYVAIGNTSVSSIQGQVGFTTYSDARFKINIKEEVKGLEFIKKLRPVTYQMDTKKLDDFMIQNMSDSIKTKRQSGMDFAPSTAVVHSGFIAQEVEQAAKDCGFNCSIVTNPADTSNSSYGLIYAEIVVPLVQGMQELSKILDSLQSEITTLKGGGQRNNGNGNDDQGHKEATNSIELANNSQPILYQNEPNPFDGSTVIRYFIPENVTGSTFVVFYDMYGKEVNKLELKERGFGKIEANTENLASGIYSYSIVVDGKSIDTKKMLKSK